MAFFMPAPGLLKPGHHQKYPVTHYRAGSSKALKYGTFGTYLDIPVEEIFQQF